MMLDSLGINLRYLRVHTQREQELIDDLMASLAGVREASPLRGQLDRLIRLGHHKPVPLKALDRPDYGHMGDPEVTREIAHTALAVRLHEVRNRLDIVLGDLGRVVSTGALVGLALVCVTHICCLVRGL